MERELAPNIPQKNDIKVENDPGASAGSVSVDSSGLIVEDPICKILVAPETVAGLFEYHTKQSIFAACTASRHRPSNYAAIKGLLLTRQRLPWGPSARCFWIFYLATVCLADDQAQKAETSQR